MLTVMAEDSVVKLRFKLLLFFVVGLSDKGFSSFSNNYLDSLP